MASRTTFSKSARNASTLVVAEHDGSAVSQGTLATVTAASKIGGDITVLVTGSAIGDAAKSAATIGGVTKVLSADHEVS